MLAGPLSLPPIESMTSTDGDPHVKRFLMMICAALAAPMALAATAHPSASPESRKSVAVVIAPAPDPSMAYVVWEEKWRPLIEALSSQSGVPLALRWDAHQKTVLDAINAQRYDFVIGPSTTIAQAIKSGYTPFVDTVGHQGVVLVVRKDSPIRSASDLTARTAHGYRLAMLNPPAVADFAGRGLLQKSGIDLSDFRAVHRYSGNGAAMLSLILGDDDIAALGRLRYEALSLPGALPLPGSFRVLSSSQETAPDVGMAYNGGGNLEDAQRLLSALENPNPATASAMRALGLSDFQNASAQDYAGMMDLAYTVPHVLTGAPVVDAGQVHAMVLARTATVIDARAQSEYLSGHIAGAVSVPYEEVSGPRIDFDAQKDTFGFGALFPNRAATYVFACNGIECWKSYKAATWALRHGYAHVLWFRGGFPAWKDAGYKVDQGARP